MLGWKNEEPKASITEGVPSRRHSSLTQERIGSRTTSFQNLTTLIHPFSHHQASSSHRESCGKVFNLRADSLDRRRRFIESQQRLARQNCNSPDSSKEQRELCERDYVLAADKALDKPHIRSGKSQSLTRNFMELTFLASMGVGTKILDKLSPSVYTDNNKKSHIGCDSLLFICLAAVSLCVTISVAVTLCGSSVMISNVLMQRDVQMIQPIKVSKVRPNHFANLFEIASDSSNWLSSMSNLSDYDKAGFQLLDTLNKQIHEASYKTKGLSERIVDLIPLYHPKDVDGGDALGNPDLYIHVAYARFDFNIRIQAMTTSRFQVDFCSNGCYLYAETPSFSTQAPFRAEKDDKLYKCTNSKQMEEVLETIFPLSNRIGIFASSGEQIYRGEVSLLFNALIYFPFITENNSTLEKYFTLIKGRPPPKVDIAKDCALGSLIILGFISQALTYAFNSFTRSGPIFLTPMSVDCDII